jgi:hypothetical protein
MMAMRDWKRARGEVLIVYRHVHESPQVLQMECENGQNHIRIYGCVPSVDWILGIHN